MPKLSIALLDSHIIFRQSFSCLVSQQLENYAVSIDAGSYDELLEQIRLYGVPDIVLLSVALPQISGYEATHLLRQRYPLIKIIAFCAICTPFSVWCMVRNGACGYLTKSATLHQVLAVLNKATQSDFECGGIGGLLVQHMLPPEIKHTQVLRDFSLSEKEIQFLQFSCSALTYKEMESKLYLSKSCVDKMRDRLCERLGVATRQELAVFTAVNGLRPDLILFLFKSYQPEPVLKVA